MSHERAVELMEIFDHFDGEYKYAEVEEALTLREEIIPLLISHLEELTADPDAYIKAERFAHNYALALLTHFREPAAHLPVIRAFSIPDKQLDDIWEELITESFPTLLFRTCGGDYEAIKALALNRDAEQFVRSAALVAIKLGVAQGELSREEALAFFAALLDDETLSQPDKYFWPALVFELLDLYPADLMDKIRALYDKGLVTEWDMPLEEIENTIEDGLEKTLAKLPEKLAAIAPDDVHKHISWFACFRGNEPDWNDEDWDDENFNDDDPFNDEYSVADACLHISQQNKKVKARKKRKQAKASKKKNRK